MDALQKINELEADLQDLQKTAEGIAIDAGGGDPDGDVAHRAGTLHTALKSVQDELQGARRELEG
jgi:ElaB/YqjD/DUF883 family membrane-anchored ribosome-binding protein